MPALLPNYSDTQRGFCACKALNTRPFGRREALSRGFCANRALNTRPFGWREALSRGFCACRALNTRPFGWREALSRGFSLVEVVLALGVISFALIGIMGLFPVALKSAEESRRETRAVLIAQQIFSDLRSGSGSNRPLARGASLADGPGLITVVSLAAATNAVMAYDSSGQGITNTVSTASLPSAVPGAVFLATVSVDTNTGVTNLSRVQATIETPAEAPSTNRAKFTFVTLMGY